MVVTHPWTRQKCFLLVLGSCAGGGEYYETQHICKKLITICELMKLFLLYKKETMV